MVRLVVRVETSEAQNAELRRRLGMNSRNSLDAAVEGLDRGDSQTACGGRCSTTTTASVPYAQTGAVVYGPNINAAAILLASEGNADRAPDGGAGRCPGGDRVRPRALARLADRLQTTRFDEAMTAALRAEGVLYAGQPPTNVIGKDSDKTTGQPMAGCPRVVTLKTELIHHKGPWQLRCPVWQGQREPQGVPRVVEGWLLAWLRRYPERPWRLAGPGCRRAAAHSDAEVAFDLGGMTP